MKKLLIILSLAFSIGLFAQDAPNWDGYKAILGRIKAPEFSNKDFVITKFGAEAGGIEDCTEAIKKTIEACANAGGGRVVIPEGTFLTGAIHLKSNVNLHVSEKAILLFSRDTKKYLPVVFTRFEGNELMNYSPFIYAYGQQNIALTGKGTIDGNADTANWWCWTGSKRTGWKPGMPNHREDKLKLQDMSDNWVPVEQRIFGEGHYIRPNFIQFYNCKNILIEDITILRSPMWEIHPVLSTNITVRGVKIKSHGANNDGCDPESCSDVLIENCYFDTGDDCIAIKSGKEEDGRRIAVPSENMIIRNCEMKDGHGGVVIGSEISGDCRNIYAYDCKMSSPNLDRALRLKSNGKRGGIIENIYFWNIEVGEVREAVVYADLFYERVSEGKYTPVVRNVFVDNVTSEKSEYAIWLKGYPNSIISNVQISNSKFEGVEKNGNNLLNFSKLKLTNVTINGQPAESSEGDEKK